MTDDDLAGAGHVSVSAALLTANALLREAVKALRTLPYGEYLRSDHWLDFRQGMLAACPVCEHCERRSTQIHHLTYDFLGRERREDVMALCGPCHTRWHADHKGERLSTPADDVVWAGNTRRFGRNED